MSHAVAVAILVAMTALSTFATELTQRSPCDVRDFNELLEREDVQAELRMTREQRADIRSSRDAIHDLQSQLRFDQPVLTTAQAAKVQEKIDTKKLTAAIKHLTEKQLLRLDQLRIQYQVLRRGLPSAMRESVDLTQEQQELLREKEVALGNELREMMWKFYRKSQQELMQVLTIEQRVIWRNMVKKEFRFDSVYAGLALLGGLL